MLRITLKMSDITNKLRLAFILTFSYEIYLSRARNVIKHGVKIFEIC